MPTDDQLEQIVHAVLARLSKRADGVDRPPSNDSAPAAASSSELVINDKVVSEATLADRLKGVQRLVVAPRAVVTPSARDLLREKNITLVRALKSAASTAAKVALATAGVKYSIEGLVRSLRNYGIEVEVVTATGLAQATSELAGRVKNEEKLAVLLTDNVAAALCIANRQSGVRAAMAGSRGELNEAIRSVGVNFLVVDAVRRGTLEVQRVVEAFATAPTRQCPAELKTWLE